ncbi:D-alanyl-D-alanine carboxypeptidase family protein [Peribacillus loiseleuriae]|uniref:D-alanyl-D-alanine carboxypeptidase family protein n=1 Tax=Peribacillus loiseleuriae TaxID=1679170 RepID=UPI003D06C411
MRFRYRVFPYICMMMIVFTLFPAKAKASLPVVSAHSAILMDQESGRVIYEENAHEKSRIASITKIMTAILAIESGKLDHTVTISSNAVGTEGSSLYLKKGEKITLENLVYGLMLRSGNDAAVAIAEEVGGSLDGFVWMMNQKAEEIGMTDSHFSNPHGLDNTENHYSTAYDMALLTRYAMKNEAYRVISGSKKHRASNSEEDWDYVWKNKNRLLTELYEYTTGGKTGYTKLAKRTLVTTATKDDLNLIAVTLNGPDDWNDHIYMYEHAFSDFKPIELLQAGPVKDVGIKQYKGKIYVKHAFTYPLSDEEEKNVEVKIKLIKPKEEWKDERSTPEVVGKAEIFYDNKRVGSRSIYYGESKEAYSEQNWSKIWKDLIQSFVRVGRHD